MNRRGFIVAAAAGAALPAAAPVARASDPFDPATWPGRTTATPETKALAARLVSAMNAQDETAIAALVSALRTTLGHYAGVPEERPIYARPISEREPSLTAVRNAFLENYRPFLTESPWRDPRQSTDRPTVRLRVSLRIAEAFLRYADSGGPDAAVFLAEARRAFDYMVSVQAPSGVFGYPYNPDTPSPVGAEANRMVELSRAQGVEIVHGGWIVDDRDTGNLNFDNAVVATGLIYANRMTGEARYLAAALRAADWAVGRRLVANFNYNALSGYLLARAYRVTRERRYLDAAKTIFRYGVFPGQMPNGRWVDQHNAKIQYHAIMMRHCAEFFLALRQARDPYAKVVARHALAGFNNMAAVARRFGASNVAEGLPLEALVIGRRVFGDRSAWRAAIAIDMNAALALGPQPLAGQIRPIAEPIAMWLAERALPTGTAFELTPLTGL